MDTVARILPGLALMLGVGLVLAVAITTIITIRTLRRPARRTYAWAVARGVPGDPSELATPRAFEQTTLRARGREFPAWIIEGDDPDGPVLISTHGWSDSKVGTLSRIDTLARRASRVVAWDAPGCGDAPGSVTLGALEPRLICEFAPALDPDDRGVVLFGWSAGAGASIVAGVLLHEQGSPVRAVVAEAPYRRAITPAINVLRESALPWRINAPLAFWYLGLRLGQGPAWRTFDRAGWSRRLAAPLLVVHGDADRVSPLADGREIADAAPEGHLVVIPGAAHNNLWSEGFADTTREAVDAFLAEHSTRRAPSGEPVRVD